MENPSSETSSPIADRYFDAESPNWHTFQYETTKYLLCKHNGTDPNKI